MTDVIPPDVRRAALRAGVRTTAQSLAGALVVTGAGVAATDLAWWQALAGSTIAALVSGVAAAVDILARGVPSDYQPTLVDPPADPNAIRDG